MGGTALPTDPFSISHTMARFCLDDERVLRTYRVSLFVERFNGGQGMLPAAAIVQTMVDAGIQRWEAEQDVQRALEPIALRYVNPQTGEVRESVFQPVFETWHKRRGTVLSRRSIPRFLANELGMSLLGTFRVPVSMMRTVKRFRMACYASMLMQSAEVVDGQVTITISRRGIERLTGVSKSTQIRYERAMGVKYRENYLRMALPETGTFLDLHLLPDEQKPRLRTINGELMVQMRSTIVDGIWGDVILDSSRTQYPSDTVNVNRPYAEDVRELAGASVRRQHFPDRTKAYGVLGLVHADVYVGEVAHNGKNVGLYVRVPESPTKDRYDPLALDHLFTIPEVRVPSPIPLSIKDMPRAPKLIWIDDAAEIVATGEAPPVVAEAAEELTPEDWEEVYRVLDDRPVVPHLHQYYRKRQ